MSSMSRVVRASVALAVVFTVGCAPAEEASEQPANPLVGAWRLVSWETRAEDGTVSLPYNGNPTGQITYTATGRMSAILMERDREFSPDSETSSESALAAVASGFFAYYGRYSVDEANSVVTHHVEGALAPNWVGTDRPRSFVFETPDRIRLSTEPDPNRTAGSIGVLVWERIPAGS